MSSKLRTIGFLLFFLVVSAYLSGCAPDGEWRKMEWKDIVGLICMSLFVVIPIIMVSQAIVKGVSKIVLAAAKPNVPRMLSKGDVKGLSRALSYRHDDHIRRAAAEALGQIGDARAVQPLLAALRDNDSDVREAAAKALDKLGWSPAQDESAAWYWTTKENWDACVRIGAPAVQPLITCLRTTYLYTRRAVAQALVRLYQKPDVSQACRQQILAVRKSITDIHDDEPHIDQPRDCWRPHTDENLGVEFPL